jgi:hypothetical protein
VDPQPRACDHCRLQILCRIDALQTESLRAAGEAQGESPTAPDEAAAEEVVDD